MDYVLTYCNLKTNRDSKTSIVINKFIFYTWYSMFGLTIDIILLDGASKNSAPVV